MARNKIEYEGKTYVAVPTEHNDDNCHGCAVCDIGIFGICDAAWCCGYDRSDGKDVVFKIKQL